MRGAGEHSVFKGGLAARIGRGGTRLFQGARRPWPILFSTGAILLLTFQILFAAVPLRWTVGDDAAGSAGTGAAADEIEAMWLRAGLDPETAKAFSEVWSQIPEDVYGATGLKDAERYFVQDGAPSRAWPSAPTGPDELMRRLNVLDVPRLPVPPVPEGEEPLRTALEEYAYAMGYTLPDVATLRLSIADLLMLPETEAAIAQLVRAYTQATVLQHEATARLTPKDRAFLAHDLATYNRWIAQHPDLGPDGYDREAIRIVETSVDVGKTYQAADLLARTVESLRPALELPPAKASAPRLAGGDATESGAEPASLTIPSLSSLGLGLPDPMELDVPVLDQLLLGLLRTNATLDLPRVSLSAALGQLATAIGGAPPPSTLPALPPSLDDAIAGIVAAKAAGYALHDPVLEANTIRRASLEALPTLRAWAALLRLSRDPQPSEARPMNLVLQNVLQGVPTLQGLLGAARGRSVQPVAEPPALGDLLVKEGLDPGSVGSVLAAIPPNLMVPLARLLYAFQLHDETYRAATAPLTEAEAFSLARSNEINQLLGATRWSPDDAQLIEAWASAVAKLDSEALDALAAAQDTLAATVESVVVVLRSEYGTTQRDQIPAPGPSVPAPRAAPFTIAPIQPPPPCFPTPFNDLCTNDVVFHLAQGRGILITGAGRSTIDNRYSGGFPALTIDLGGDDLYSISAGGTSGGIMERALGNPIPFSANPTSGTLGAVTIDLGGSDLYSTVYASAHGSADGFGRFGLLWDDQGNDRYEHLADPSLGSSLPRRSQGWGFWNGMGILWDEQGTDRYYAPLANGQGVALTNGLIPEVWNLFGLPLCCFIPANEKNGPVGWLIDRGAGDDSYDIEAGQGTAGGVASIGLLVDVEGRSEYKLRSPMVHMQGGRSDVQTLPPVAAVVPYGRGTGLGALIDLGGRGDKYTLLPLEAPQMSLTHPNHAQDERQDDALWFNPITPVGFGLDTTLADEDGDLMPNLVELAAGTDPARADGAISDPAGTLASAVETINALVEGSADSDGDLFSDGTEQASGSDPADSASTPATAAQELARERLQDFLVPADRSLCESFTSPCSAPLSFLIVSGIGSSEYTEPGLITIDLGGDDLYLHRVAGYGQVAYANGANTVQVNVGSIHLELGGNDTYDTPTMTDTLASSSSAILTDPAGGTGTTAGPPGGASVLLEIAGNDNYAAARRTLGSAIRGVAVFVDFEGSDTYDTPILAQGYGGDGFAGMIDLRGDDSYRFAAQAQMFRNAIDTASSAACCVPGGALTFDGAGTDRYESSFFTIQNVVNPAQDAALFGVQGFASFTIGTTAVQVAGAATFWDIGTDFDEYIAYNTQGGLLDVSPNKNDQVVQATQLSLFFDGAVLNQTDHDGDGASGTAEAVAGTNATDPTSHPGSFLLLAQRAQQSAGRASTNPTSWAANLPQEGSSVSGIDSTVPLVNLANYQVRSRLGPHPVMLPGLVIGGRGADTYGEYTGFTVDLGGSDRYVAPYAGGANPFTYGALVNLAPFGGTNPGTPMDVVLLLDAGSNQPDMDVYAPSPASCTLNRNTTENWFGEGYSTGTTSFAVRPTSCPSLGGALTGVSVLADFGGFNSFITTNSISLTAYTTGGAPNRAAVNSFGATQGAGLFGGVGLLFTWNSVNTFSATVVANAAETMPVPGAFQPAPVSRAWGAAQGAGYGGIGVLASFGAGNDVYNVRTQASAPQAGNLDGGTTAGLAQGAGIHGIGMLLDRGGTNTYTAPSGSSQGFAFGWSNPENVLFFTNLTRSNAGILWSGIGDDNYLSGTLSQASAQSRTRGDMVSGPAAATLRPNGVPGPLALLLDGGGNDNYLIQPVAPPSPTRCPVPDLIVGCVLSQAASSYESIALLLDASGDDVYSAPSYSWVQAAAVHGSAALLDFGGNDLYAATTRAQGYAAHVAINTVSTGAVQLHDYAPTFALLADFQGRDKYAAVASAPGNLNRAQGAAEMVNHNAFFLANPSVAIACAPGTTPVSGCPVSATGYLLDAEGSDRYEYTSSAAKMATMVGVPPSASSQAPPPTRPPDDNGWNWTQTFAPYGFVMSGGAAGLGGGTDDNNLNDAWQTFQQTWSGRPGAVDSGGRQMNAPVTVTVQAFPDPTGAGTLPNPISRTIFVQAVVQPLRGDNSNGLNAGDIDRVDFLANNEVVARGVLQSSSSPSRLVYQAPWATTTNADTPGLVRHPDGTYSLSAAVFVRPKPVSDGAGSAGVASPAMYVESSNQISVVVDNAPHAGLSLQRSAMSARTGPSALADIRVGPDRCCPSGVTIPPGAEPGGRFWLNLTHLGTGAVHPYSSGYIFRGELTIMILGTCSGTTCADGLYNVTVDIVDGIGQGVRRNRTLLIDSTPPYSRITTAANAGGRDVGPSDRLLIRWEAAENTTDANGGNFSGFRDITLLRFSDDLQTSTVIARSTAARGELEVPNVQPGDSVNFMVAARDTAGNMESIEPGSQRVRRIRFDPQAPIVTGLAASATHIRPGAPVEFTAQAFDLISAIQPPVMITFSDGFSASMTPVAGTTDRFTYRDWGDHNDQSTPDEAVFIYTVTARDLAGNPRTISADAILDGLPPRITIQEVDYGRNADGSVRVATQAGQPVTIRASVQDIALASASPVTLGLEALPGALPDPDACESADEEPTLWTCQLTLPVPLADGAHEVALVARDLAGNSAREPTLIQVSARPVQISNVRVTQTSFDRVTLEWDTDFPATSTVHYGRTLLLDAHTTLAGFRTLHNVTVPGLTPSTGYYFAVESLSVAGVANRSQSMPNRTQSGFEVEVVLPASPRLSGKVDLALLVKTLFGNNPVSLSIKLQDATQRAHPVSLVELEAAEDTAWEFDTKTLADGDYRIIVDARRLSDAQRLQTAIFAIDNTPPLVSALSPAPGATTATNRPEIRVAVVDPQSSQAPSPSTARLLVNGAPVGAEFAYRTDQPTQLQVKLLEGLPEGRLNVTLEVVDAAGNRGELAWSITVDTRAPGLLNKPALRFYPGPGAARPGSYVHVGINLSDPSGIAEAWLDARSIGAPNQTLRFSKRDNWTANLTIPATATNGPARIPIMGKDGLGNQGEVGRLELVVDALAPKANRLAAQAIGKTAVRIELEASEPVRLQIRGASGMVDSKSASVAPALVLGRLRPGTTHEIEATFIDLAGNPSVETVRVTLPPDTQAPGTPAILNASSPLEGRVRLEWSPVADDSEVEFYEVRASDGERSRLVARTPETQHEDREARAGRWVTYAVVAVDLAGNRGESAEFRVFVTALPHLLNASVTPRIGTVADLFHFVVEYRHLGGEAPDSIHVLIKGETVPLQRVRPEENCAFSCLFEARTRLAPTQMTSARDPPVFVATVAGHEAEIRLQEEVRVFADAKQLAAAQGENARATAGPGWALLLLAAIIVTSTKRRSKEEE